MAGNNRRGIVIQPRDRHLLFETAAVLRFIDREQAKLVAGFGSTTRANTRLLALYRAGLLRRFFQGTVAGGTKALYACSETGAKLVGAPYTRHRYRNDELLITSGLLSHLSSVNWIYCWAKYTPCPTPGVSFVRWASFREPIAASLAPDGCFEMTTPDGSVASFIEVDLGSEGAAVWKAKVRNYLQYAGSGQFENRFTLPRFRVLVVTNEEKRAHKIRQVVCSLTPKIFWFSTVGALRVQGFWSPVWQRPSSDERQSLA